MRFNDVDCFRILRALELYQEKEVSHDLIWEQYDRLISKVKAYQENYSAPLEN